MLRVGKENDRFHEAKGNGREELLFVQWIQNFGSEIERILGIDGVISYTTI